MNKYGEMARRHWEQTDPARVAKIADPVEFFSTLGRQVESKVLDLQTRLAGPDPAGESYLEKVGRLNAANAQAEEAVFAELAWITPTETDDEDEADPDEPMDVMHQHRRAVWEASRPEDDQ